MKFCSVFWDDFRGDLVCLHSNQRISGHFQLRRGCTHRTPPGPIGRGFSDRLDQQDMHQTPSDFPVTESQCVSENDGNEADNA